MNPQRQRRGRSAKREVGVILALLLVAGAMMPRGLQAQAEPSAPTAAAPSDATPPEAMPSAGAEETPAKDPAAEFESELAKDLEKEFQESAQEEVFDPLSGYNRFMTGFNDGLYEYALSPVARGYRFVTPTFVRRGFNNFFDNLLYPLRFVNNLLQLKLSGASVETVRFVTNTTIGIGGLWDPAQLWFGLEPRREDFGQTLGYYGVGAGFHVVLPVLGPSNLRDAFSVVPDAYSNPVTYLEPWEQEAMVRAFERVNYTSLHLGEYENLKKDAIDLYPFLRDLYEQNRKREIEQ